MNHTDGPLTTRDVAAIFAVTPTTVKRWVEAGRLQALKTPGGHYRFEPSDVDAFRESLMTPAAS